jgi:hypothetical protein
MWPFYYIVQLLTLVFLVRQIPKQVQKVDTQKKIVVRVHNGIVKNKVI